MLLDSPLLSGWKANAVGMAKRTQVVGSISPGKVSRQRRFSWASNEEALDDTNSTLYIKLRPLSRDVTSLSEYANFLSSNVNFMLDAVLGLINIEQNEIVKIFTVAAVVFMPPTLIASIYGMNFAHMPGLENEYGYYISLVVMLVSIILPLVYFRSRRLL